MGNGSCRVKKVCIVVGHKRTSPGACNVRSKISEFDYNEILATIIHTKMPDTQIIYRRTYSRLPDDINMYNPDYVISLHCNAFNEKATGTETLYYHKSKEGKKLAEKLQKSIVNCLRLRDRGIKEKTSEDRGGYLLKYTNAPCVILEPFFIDNNEDYTGGLNNIEPFATAIVDVLKDLP